MLRVLGPYATCLAERFVKAAFYLFILASRASLSQEAREAQAAQAAQEAQAEEKIALLLGGYRFAFIEVMCLCCVFVV